MLGIESPALPGKMNHDETLRLLFVAQQDVVAAGPIRKYFDGDACKNVGRVQFAKELGVDGFRLFGGWINPSLGQWRMRILRVFHESEVRAVYRE